MKCALPYYFLSLLTRLPVSFYSSAHESRSAQPKKENKTAKNGKIRESFEEDWEMSPTVRRRVIIHPFRQRSDEAGSTASTGRQSCFLFRFSFFLASVSSAWLGSAGLGWAWPKKRNAKLVCTATSASCLCRFANTAAKLPRCVVCTRRRCVKGNSRTKSLGGIVFLLTHSTCQLTCAMVAVPDVDGCVARSFIVVR